MKKQSIYLPTLNSLFMQDVNYRMHRYKLNNLKSSYENYSNTLSVNNSANLLPKQVILLQREENSSPLRKIRSKHLIKYHSTEISQRKVMNKSPYQRKKHSERENQNQRIKQILKSSKCSGYGRSRSSIENYEVLRERIRKYIRDGRSVNYKFKKSLLEISKRKEANLQIPTQNVKESIVDEARKIIARSQQKQMAKNRDSNRSINDIYLQTMRTEMNDHTKRESEVRIKTEGSQAMSQFNQNGRTSLMKKEAGSKGIANAQSFQAILNNGGKEAQKPLLDYMAQIKLKKKEKLKQQIVIPKSMFVNLKKSKIKDLQVVEVSPYQQMKKQSEQITK